MTTPTTTLRQFAESLNAAIRANPTAFVIAPEVRAQMLDRADAQILKFYGVKSRKDIQ